LANYNRPAIAALFKESAFAFMTKPLSRNVKHVSEAMVWSLYCITGGHPSFHFLLVLFSEKVDGFELLTVFCLNFAPYTTVRNSRSLLTDFRNSTAASITPCGHYSAPGVFRRGADSFCTKCNNTIDFTYLWSHAHLSEPLSKAM